ncbi:uncharacterized protein J8A68_001909 [[Candida] subhashii]|uniref:ER membrane protein complex subunit 3 n=1 Tax=[Candida] subhashii TaxID=561895 RepID=A0A8J5UYS9_9ASCO|nr:uncharacterized protein J8A68_001909 [[Candida] subhashii]KAG7664565.1 hypothetical protein J8A68_001909 [[Candida] subhashii]
MAVTPDLLLDPQLKYWVLLPISLTMVLVGLLRSNITTLFITPKPKLPAYKISRQQQFLQQVTSFKSNNNKVLTPEEFSQRKQYYLSQLSDTHFQNIDPSQSSSEQQQPSLSQLFDPNQNEAMMNMAKGNLLNYIPQTIIMAWVNYFFAGFIIMKLPFGITDGFKPMLQSGGAPPDLSVRYVSSISWYFVNLMGLKPIYSLIMGRGEADELMMQQTQQQQQQAPVMGGGPGQPSADKVFKKEFENVQILEQTESIYVGIVDRVLKQYE